MTDTKPTPGWATIVLADEEAAALGPTIPPLRPVLAFPSVEARDAAADVLSLGRLGGAVLAARAERDAALEKVWKLEAGLRGLLDGLRSESVSVQLQARAEARALLPKETDNGE